MLKTMTHVCTTGVIAQYTYEIVHFQDDMKSQMVFTSHVESECHQYMAFAGESSLRELGSWYTGMVSWCVGRLPSSLANSNTSVGNTFVTTAGLLSSCHICFCRSQVQEPKCPQQYLGFLGLGLHTL